MLITNLRDSVLGFRAMCEDLETLEAKIGCNCAIDGVYGVETWNVFGHVRRD